MAFNKKQIKEIIPYSDPFLFVDKVEKIEGDEIFGFYQTSNADSYFKGHFVDFPIMPGVLTVEALAQLSTIFLRKRIGRNHRKFHLLAYDVKGAQFYKPIFPGDNIALQARISEITGGRIARVQAKAFVDGELKCSAAFSVAIVNKDRFKAKYVRDKPRIKNTM